MATNESGRVPAVSVTFHRGDHAECGVDEQPAYMRLAFGNGIVHEVARDALTTLADAFMWHGAKQKFIDAGAISRNPETGRTASVSDKADAVLEVVERTTGADPRWSKAREGGTGSGTLLLAALERLYAGKKDRAALVAYLDGLSTEEKRQLERNARVAPIIEAIRTERRLAAGKADDGEALLAALDE